MKNKTIISVRPSLTGISRRSLLKGVAVTGLAAPFVNRLVTPARAAGNGEVNIALYGGAFSEAFKEVWADPFEKETGIKVNMGTGASLALAKLQTLNPAGAEWDIVDLTNSGYITAVREDLLEPLDPNQVDTSKLVPDYVKSHGYCYAVYVWVIGWNKKLINGADAPKGWADVWNLQKYPGKRSLDVIDDSGPTIEAALFADGLNKDTMYPIDVNRGFASLDKLGKDNIIWAEALQEPVQRIGSGETPIGGIYTGRAIMANRNGASIDFTMREGIVGGDMLPVGKNAKNKKEAFALLNFVATRGDLAAKFTARTSYGVPYMGVESMLPKEADDIRASLPTNPDMLQTGLVTDDAWWADNMESVAMRFKEWQLS
jgi:putative spermidine/putrescine transport system substrate-binding protein